MTEPSFNEMCNRAAAELPEGYEIEISLERGSGSIRLFDFFGNKRDFEIDGPFHGTLTAAIERAKEVAPTGEHP